MIVGRSSTFQGENPVIPATEVPPAGLPDVGLMGNSNDAEDVYGDRFKFESGDNSNVVVTIDKDEKDSEDRIKVKIDVYYV